MAAGDISPQTLATADEILKEYYLSGFQKALQSETVLLNRFQTKTTPIYGEHFQFALQSARNWGTGPRAGTQGDATGEGYLPVPGHQAYKQGVLERKHYYARFKITGSALSAAKKSGSMVELLGNEMRGAKTDLAKHVNRDLYGTGDGRLATCTPVDSSTTTQILDDTRNLEVGMEIVFCDASGDNGLERTVSSITDSTDIVVNAALNTNTNTLVMVMPGGMHDTDQSSAYDNALEGLGLIFSTTTYAGVSSRSTTASWFVPELDATTTELSFDLIQLMKNRMRINAGGKCTLIVTSETQWRAFGNIMNVEYKRWPGNVTKLTGGFDALDFVGVPITWDPDCPAGHMYFLDESTFRILQEDPVHFIDDDGHVLVRVGGGKTAEDAFEATLVWRVNLACTNPLKNARCSLLAT